MTATSIGVRRAVLPTLFEAAARGEGGIVQQLTWTFMLLGVPTALMGATLPVALGALRDEAIPHEQVTLLYGLNLLGGALGAGAAGYLLIWKLGVTGTASLALGLAAATGAVALLLSRTSPLGVDHGCGKLNGHLNIKVRSMLDDRKRVSGQTSQAARAPGEPHERRRFLGYLGAAGCLLLDACFEDRPAARSADTGSSADVGADDTTRSDAAADATSDGSQPDGSKLDGSKTKDAAVDSKGPPADGGDCPGADITSVVPSSAYRGNTITINGNNFGTSIALGDVWFGSTRASTITVWNTTQIKVVVPSAAYSGSLTLTVYYDGQCRGVASFTVLTSGGCVVAGTRVLLVDGTSRPIEELSAGDRIRGVDLATFVVKPAGVERFMRHQGSYRIDRITLSGGSSLRVTGNHPVLVKGGRWTEVDHLKAGDVVYTFNPDTRRAEETAIRSIVRGESHTDVVYNITTSSSHYFANGLLVHNK